MSRIIAGAAGGTPAGQRAREPDPAHHRPRQGSTVLPAGRLRGHCRRPRAGSVRGLRLPGRGERQPRRAEPWTWSNSTPRPAPSASGTRTWSTPSRAARWSPCTAPRSNPSWSGPPRRCRWDLVFLDPPYPLDEPALAAVLAKLVPHLARGRRGGGGTLVPDPRTGLARGHGTVRREEVRRNPAVVRRAGRGSRGRRRRQRTEAVASPPAASSSTPARTLAGCGPRAVSAAVHTSGHGPCVPARMMFPGYRPVNMPASAKAATSAMARRMAATWLRTRVSPGSSPTLTISTPRGVSLAAASW